MDMEAGPILGCSQMHVATHTQTGSQKHSLYTHLKVILTQALETRIRVATKTVTPWPLSPKPGIPRPGLFQHEGYPGPGLATRCIHTAS